MPHKSILISTGSLNRQTLAGQTAVVTGAGGGIGFEAARALVWLGANVVIAEVDAKKGKTAEKDLNAEFGADCVLFHHTDVGDERSVRGLARQAERTFGRVDIVINNATYAPLGGVTERPVEDWDKSYRVNLRGPVLLAQAFLPGMIQRNLGVFLCVSSVGGAYMGAYETLKSAQVEFARTLDGELEGTDVIAFTIGPGIVPTETMKAGVAQIAPRYGKTPQEFYETYKDQWLTVEAAGTGFAAAAALARRYRGMEIYSAAALIAAGIDDDSAVPPAAAQTSLSAEQAAEALCLCREVHAVLKHEYEGWLKRSIFERQWMLRDFKQHAGLPVEEVLANLTDLQTRLDKNETTGLKKYAAAAQKVDTYFQHYQVLTQGAIKDPAKAKELVAVMQGWRESAQKLALLLAG